MINPINLIMEYAGDDTLRNKLLHFLHADTSRV